MSTEKKKNVYGTYSRLYVLRKTLSQVNPKLATMSDKCLSSTGYSALFLSTFLNAPHSTRLQALSGMISDYRMFWRMYYTPATLEWAVNLLVDNPQKNTFLRWCDYTQAVCGVFYQVLEDVAYLAMKGVLPISAETQAHLWVISCLSWAVHVALELVKIAYFQAIGRPYSKRDLWVNLSWAPLTVHWSTYSGVVSPRMVGLLGACACIPNLIAGWKAC